MYEEEARNRHEFDAEMYPDTPQKAEEVKIGILRSIRTQLWFMLVWMAVLTVLHACAT